MALLVVIAVLAFASAANAQCTKTPPFKGAATSFTNCKTLLPNDTTLPMSANLAWTATGNTISGIVSCTGLGTKGSCGFGLSPTGKMQNSNAVVGYPNPAGVGAKVALYSLGNHKNVKIINSGIGAYARLTAKDVEVAGPNAVNVKFTLVTRNKKLWSIWAFGKVAADYAKGTLGGHLLKAHGSSPATLFV